MTSRHGGNLIIGFRYNVQVRSLHCDATHRIFVRLFVRKKLTVIQEFALFSFIGENLKVFELTLTSYNALYEVKYCKMKRRYIGILVGPVF